MPRVKVDYIVSFSNEDPENPASNLLSWDVNKSKWLCQKGESSCSVVLQLVKAVQINSIQIGVYHAAIVEVLVGKSEKPNEPFQVLVPSSVFLTPIECRRGESVEKVRSFSADQLTEVREQRWDRIRVVCSQPYNKHCKYGLSFIHINEPESQPKPTETRPEEQKPSAVPNRLFDLDAMSSDDEDFKPGELFAKHNLTLSSEGHSTDAQIRQASSQAIKNISDSATKLMKTPINKQNKYGAPKETSERQDRQRNSILYTDDDDQPHSKIDHIVNRHKDEKAKAELDRTEKLRIAEKKNDSYSSKDEKVKQGDNNISKEEREPKKDSHKKDDISSKDKKEKRDSRKRDDSDKNLTPSHSRTKESDKVKPGVLRPGPITDSPHDLLSDVTFVLSGYENPRRAEVRDKAMAMGAKFQRDWDQDCTHLICAFPNTPKLKTVRSSSNGPSAIIVTADWIEECCDKRRRLPWQWYATEHKYRVTKGDIDAKEETIKGSKRSSNSNQLDSDETPTKNKRIKREPEVRDDRRERDRKSPKKSDSEHNSSVVFIKDERMQGNVTISDSDSHSTDEDEIQRKCSVDDRATLPDFFDGYTFVIDDDVTVDKQMLMRYVKAYGGVIIEQSQLDEDSKVDYWLCASSRDVATGKPIRADWVWKCHENKTCWPIKEYLIC